MALAKEGAGAERFAFSPYVSIIYMLAWRTIDCCLFRSRYFVILTFTNYLSLYFADKMQKFFKLVSVVIKGISIKHLNLCVCIQLAPSEGWEPSISK